MVSRRLTKKQGERNPTVLIWDTEKTRGKMGIGKTQAPRQVLRSREGKVDVHGY